MSAICIAAVALISTAVDSVEDSRLPGHMAVIAFLAVAGSMMALEWLRLALMECATLYSVIPVWRAARTASARHVYAAIVALSATCLVLSQALTGPAQVHWSRALLLTGVCIKFAAVPFSFWILSLADELPAALLGMIVSVVDVAAVGEFALRAHSDPGLFLQTGPWLTVAVLTSISAGLLMLAQRSIKRLLVLSSIEDFGFMLLGMASLSSFGRDAVILAAASHALAKCLLFTSIAMPERDGLLPAHTGGMAQRYPVSAFGFLFGMLAMLGVPPTLGFAGRWKLYESALSIHPALLAGFVLASVLALLAYINVFTSFWWGPAPVLHGPGSGEDDEHWHSPPCIHEGLMLRGIIVALVTCLLVAGLWPMAIVHAFEGGRP